MVTGTPPVTHIYTTPSSNQRSTTSREASASWRLRPNEVTREMNLHTKTRRQASCHKTVVEDQNFGSVLVLLVSQPAADCLVASASVVALIVLAVISRPFLFISNLCFRSKPLTNSRVALPTAPGRLDASTLTIDSAVSSFRSR